MCTERDGNSTDEAITPAMIDAGEDAILCEVGGADLGGYFSARELACRVYRAMDSLRTTKSSPPSRRTGRAFLPNVRTS